MSDATFTRPTPAPLHSAQWFRVAGLRPRLDPHAVAQRSVQRGARWHVLQRADGRQSFRLNAAAWAAVARCDGQRTLQAVWDIALAELGERAPTQDELLDMLARLHSAGLMSFDRAPDFGAASAGASVTATEPAAERNSLLAWRIPLGQPDAWLTRLLPVTRGLFTPLATALWTLAMAAAALAAWAHADELGHALQRQLSAPHLLLWAALIYPLMKALHELAHGLAARHAGAAVPGWGISLLMGVPTPYVDASAASALPLQRQRLAVAAAGMVLELGLAAAALALWLLLQDGLLRELALLVVSIGALSSLAINANPLLRFDGYHLLCDALDLPNLAERSRRHVLHALRQRLLGPSEGAPVQPAPGEAKWLWLYAPAAVLMRWAVMLGLVSWLGALSWPLGAAAAALAVWSLLVQPLLALWRWLQRTSAPARPLRRRAAVIAGLIALPLLAVPLPDTTVAPGVLWLPEHALVRAQTDGVVDAVLAADGQAVRAGEPLLRLRAPQRDAELVQLSGRIEALQSTWLQALRSDAAAAVTAAHQLQTAQAALTEAQARAEQLTVRAARAGRLALPHAADLPGRFVARGSLLAHVITGEPGLVRVAIAHEHAAQLRAHPGPVAVRTAGDALAPARTGQWSGRTSGAGALLPSAALGEASGGSIATDPADGQGLRPARPVVLADVPLQGAPLTRLGERAWVRFEHGHAPLAWQALRAVQQQVLGHFNPGA